jgi:hypothetical protein
MSLTKKNGDYALMFTALGVAKRILNQGGLRRIVLTPVNLSPIIKFVKP